MTQSDRKTKAYFMVRELVERGIPVRNAMDKAAKAGYKISATTYYKYSKGVGEKVGEGKYELNAPEKVDKPATPTEQEIELKRLIEENTKLKQIAIKYVTEHLRDFI